MSTLSRIRSAFASKPAPPPPASPAAVAVRSVGATISPHYQGRPQWLVRTPESLRREGLEKLALIFRCVQFTSNAAGQSGVTLRVYDDGPAGDRVPIDDHPLRLLMRQPNPRMREGRFISFVTMVACTSGFCVWEKVRSGAGRVVALEPLNNDWLKPILRDQAEPDWEYRIPGIGAAFMLPSSEVQIFTYADRPDMRMNPLGYGPVEAVFREIGLLNVMTDFLKVFFDRGAMPVYGAIVDSMPGAPIMSQAEKDALTEAFVARHGGLDKAAMPILLEGIKDVKRLSFDFDELALTDIRDMSDIAICQAFGIDPALISTRAGMEHSDARANATEASRKFYRDVMIPLWNRLDETFTLGLLSEFEAMPSTRELAFDYSDVHALQADHAARASWLGVAAQQGIISQHMFLAEMGLKIPETDDFYLRGLAVEAIPVDDPLGVATQKAADDRAAAAAKALADKAATMPPPDATKAPPGKKPPKMPMEGLIAFETLVGVPPTEQLAARARIASSNRKMIDHIAKVAEPMLSTFFRLQGERVLAAVKSPAGIAEYARISATPLVLVAGRNGHATERLDVAAIDWDKEHKRLNDTLGKVYHLAGETAASAVSDQVGVGVSWDLANPNVRDVMGRLATRVKGIDETSRNAIAEAVTKSAESGKGTAGLTEDLKSMFSDWSDSRAATVARTESMASYGMASAAGYRMSDVVDRIQCFDNPMHTDDYGADDGLSCAERDGYIDTLDSADLHIESEHPNGSLAIAPVLKGAE